MNKLTPLLLCLFISITAFSKNTYKVDINLKEIKDDKVFVQIDLPGNIPEHALFVFPKTIQGTYSDISYGNFVSDLHFYDKDGNEIKNKRNTANSYKVTKPELCTRVTYYMKDSWDEPFGSKLKLFEPSGTSFSDKSNVLNFGGLVGYFYGHVDYTFELKIQHKADHYGSTALPNIKRGKDFDILTAPNYHELIDNPAFYAPADTTSMMLGDSKVSFACISPDSNITSKKLKEVVKDLVPTTFDYIPEMYRDDYTFLVYISDEENVNSFGALEHNTSSLYFLPNDTSNLDYNFGATAVHEMFHLITPLNLRSEIIDDFDYFKPEMSEHLWFYEGIVEYLCSKTLAKHAYNKKQDSTNLFKNIYSKLQTSNRYYKQYPFLKSSKQILKKKYNNDYGDIYERGPVVAFVIDLTLRRTTNNEKGILDLIEYLGTKYNQEKAFKEGDLIDDIIAYNKNLAPIFDKYVADNEAIPLSNLYKEIGIQTRVDTVHTTYTNWGVHSFRNKKNKLIVMNSPLNDTLELEKIQIEEIDGEKVQKSFNWVLDKIIYKEADSITIQYRVGKELMTYEYEPMESEVSYPTIQFKLDEKFYDLYWSLILE